MSTYSSFEGSFGTSEDPYIAAMRAISGTYNLPGDLRSTVATESSRVVLQELRAQDIGVEPASWQQSSPQKFVPFHPDWEL